MRPIDADVLQELCDKRIHDTWNSGTAPVSWAHAYADFKDDIDSIPTLTPPNISSDLISRSALLMGETQPEITTGSDSELAEHMEWERWMDKIKRAPAVGKEAAP